MIQTSGRDARIRFRTDSSITRSGFSFDYMQVDSLCGATLSGWFLSGVLLADPLKSDHAVDLTM